MTSNESNQVFSDAGIINNDGNGEWVLKITDKSMGNEWQCTRLPSPKILKIKLEVDEDVTGNGDTEFQSPYPKIKQERCENLKEQTLLSSSSENFVKILEKINEDINDVDKSVHCTALANIIPSRSAEGNDTNGWIFKVMNVQSSDLQVVVSGNFDSGRMTKSDRHQDDIHTQVEIIDTTVDKEYAPEESEQNQQELEERPFCELCSLHVETVGEYYDHLKTHFSEMSLKCLLCDKVFVRKMNLFNHLRSHANHKDFKRICKYCKKIFSCPSKRKVHEYTHTGVKSYMCTYCSMEFTRENDLKKHEYNHAGVKPYKCTYCDKTFTKRSHFMEHERIHTGVKPYKCTYCNKAFTVQCTLKKHERIHTGVKPYMCTQCNKAFPRQDSLKEHERMHTGVKPYSCTFCNKAFTRKHDKKKHEYIHTGFKPYKCTYCNKAFARQHDQKKHESNHTSVHSVIWHLHD